MGDTKKIYPVQFGQDEAGHWVWRCDCDKCRALAVRPMRGAFTTQRQAEKDCKKELARHYFHNSVCN